MPSRQTLATIAGPSLEEAVAGPRYAVREPGPILAPFITSIWLYDNGPRPHALERILPTGAAQLIVNLKQDETRIYDPERVEVLLYQLVNLLRDGKPYKMGKRLGNLVTIEEVIEEIDEAAGQLFEPVAGKRLGEAVEGRLPRRVGTAEFLFGLALQQPR